MSDLVEPEGVEVDAEAVATLRIASAEVDKWSRIAATMRKRIEESLGDAEYATVCGQPVIRWAHVKTRRLDTAKLRENVDPAVLASCYVETVSRRFLQLWTRDD